ncbi:MAG: cytochrome b561 domain-containing protein [Syntrophorhabdaceae bacterium]|nr:cytochrome b561 domain-containing protein [Syntrophorhabdaceae bacterium]
MPFYYFHGFLMFIGFVAMIVGFITARFMKKKTWWLRLHKIVNIVGASSTFGGIIVMVIYISLTGGGHFNTIHAYLGFFIGFLSVITPVIGFLQIKAVRTRIKFRPIHRFSGRLLIILMFINIIMGLRIAGVI